MKIFEFHFNPKTREDLIFDSFCYEPENVYEKRVGNLYMVGVLKNSLPQNRRFLDNLSRVLKEKYYKAFASSSEKAIKESLRKGNDFLERIAKEGDVSWLGNISFTAIAVKGFDFNFTKTGDLKILLLREGGIIDMDQKLKTEGNDPYPLKIFGNILSGKLKENDVILVLTPDIFEFFLKEKIIDEIAYLSASVKSKEDSFDQKKLKDILNSKSEKLAELSGICLFLNATKEIIPKEREVFSPKRPAFSLKKQIFEPISKFIKFREIKENTLFRFKSLKNIPEKIKNKLKKEKKAVHKNKEKKPAFKLPKLKLFPKIKKPTLPSFQIKFKGLNIKSKKIYPIIALILILILGYFIFAGREAKQVEKYKETLIQIENKITEADTYLLVSESNPQARINANALLEESWQEISSLIKVSSGFPRNFKNEIENVKQNLSEKLYEINKLTEISDPELFFEFNPRELVPKKIVLCGEGIISYSPHSKIIYSINKNGDKKIMESAENQNLSISFETSALLFSASGKITLTDNKELKDYGSIKIPYQGFSFDSLTSYQNNFYFLDSKNGKIIKYDSQFKSPTLWLQYGEIATDMKSISVDGSLWALTKNNSIKRYYGGNFRENLALSIFPYPKEFSKIFTKSGLSYIYILEPVQKRIIITDKSGNIFKQIKSESFDNLLDFTVSEDGKTIYLLNGMKIYVLSI